jgi:hypothetical protein
MMGKNVVDKQDINDPNYISLRTYVDTRFTDNEAARLLAFAAMEKRLDTMNEFRESLKDAQSTFLTKEAYDLAHSNMTKMIDDLRLFRSNYEGKSSFATLLAIIGIFIGLSAVVLDFLKMAK